MLGVSANVCDAAYHKFVDAAGFDDAFPNRLPLEVISAQFRLEEMTVGVDGSVVLKRYVEV